MKKSALTLCFTLMPMSASAFCLMPSEPYCASSYGPFSNNFEFNQCRDEVEAYQQQAERYSTCIIDNANDEISEIQEDAERDLNEIDRSVVDAIDNFNRRAQQ